MKTRENGDIILNAHKGVMPMDRNRLNQYKALKREIPHINKKLDKLYKKQSEIPVVAGKVQASSKNFPYTAMRVSVQMHEPKEAERIKKQIRINEERLEKAEEELLEIESFIAGIPNSNDRHIFEMVFLEGKSYEKAGKVVGYSKGRISQKISAILKD